MMGPITLRAFAKINLSLRVKDARADGFHEVQTILQAIDLCDRVTCESRRGPFEIRCTTPGVPTDCTNLVWKASQRLWKAAGRDGRLRNVAVTIEKHIPMQAGLGGGSSDAAAALVGLRRLWRLRVADEELRTLAAEIGSDVPYFLVGGTALAIGRGEEVYPLLDLPRLWVVLAVPPFGVATKDAYLWLDQERRTRRGLTPSGARVLFRDTWLGRDLPLVNDLERPVIKHHPLVGRLKAQLSQDGAGVAAMSGSGSTVFGVFSSAASARKAAQKVILMGADARLARFQRRVAPWACP